MGDAHDKEGRERTEEHEAPPSPPLTRRAVGSARGMLHPFLRAVIFAAGAFVLTSFLTALFLGLFRLSPYTYQGWPIFLLYLLLDLMLLALSWLCLELFDRREFAALGLWFYPGWGRETAWGVVGSAALITVIVAAMVAARGLSYAGINYSS